ncbi:MAG: ribbon-helix-helix protein, CopG family, partial [Moorea sp. SIO4G3]|nr:ribbon-helix-helix protein, CopG family [Moorena sp. SIO4G3]
MPKKSRKTASQYSEGKSKVGISLTPTGIGLLTQMAQNTGLSRSELIERIARGKLLGVGILFFGKHFRTALPVFLLIGLICSYL